MHRYLALIALMAIALPLPARAIPGQSTAAFLKWAHSNPAIPKLRTTKSDMSGGAVYQADVTFGSKRAFFSTEPVAGVIDNERLAVQGVADNYDLRKHRDVAQAMAARVYGGAIASDLASAVQVGDFPIFGAPNRVTILRGRKYSYELTGPLLMTLRLSDLAQELKNAKQCAARQCGD